MQTLQCMEPPIKDPLRRGHNRHNLSTKDTLQGPKCSFSHIVNTFRTSKEWTTSIQRTKWLAPTCSSWFHCTSTSIISIITFIATGKCLQIIFFTKLIHKKGKNTYTFNVSEIVDWKSSSAIRKYINKLMTSRRILIHKHQ